MEVSGHRGLGRIYLTDFRLVILCTDATSTNLAKTSVGSLFINSAFSMITDVLMTSEKKCFVTISAEFLQI